MNADKQVVIHDAVTAEDFAAARALCNGFRDWVVERYEDLSWMVDTYYKPEAWEPFLATLPTIHAPPEGALLLARLDDEPVGCIMMQKMTADACEMKRLFVSDAGRGRGIARKLCEVLIARAKAVPYSIMRLETATPNYEALALYEDLGFVRVPPYRDHGADMLKAMIFMEAQLDPAA